MKRRARIWRSGIRVRVVLLALIPLLAIAFVIGGYTVRERLADARTSLDERGRIMAANLAMAAERAVLTRDLKRLEGLCQAALKQPDVDWVAIRDANGALLVQTGVAPGGGATHSTFRAAVGATGVEVEDFNPETGAGPLQPLGWAEVQVSLAGTLARQRQIQLNSLLIIGGGLVISLLVALRIGSGISRPLLELSQAMSRYRDGEAGVRIATEAGGEIGELAQDFNRMVQALEVAQSNLREQVSAATAELQRAVEALSAKNAQLETAREEAVRAGEEKYEFLARMSHEIRTPLNAVIGFSRLLSSSDPGLQGIREYCRTIDRAANQLITVVDGILNFTKLEAGSLEIERVPFDLRTCLEDVVAMLSPVAHEKGLELALVLHHDIPETLAGDPNRIAQVLVNLLDNAIKFTAVGHVLVEAGYVQDEQGQGTVRVTVSDTGVGLSVQELERLFQPFAQADSSVTRRYGGTGLGLVICKRLVELMGGRIGVESEPAKGSRFFFTIQCGAASQSVSAPPASPLAGLKVLVYDHEPAQLRALRTVLLGWSIQVFNSGRRERIAEMLESAANRSAPFDLLILGLSANESRRDNFDVLMAEIRSQFAGAVLVLVGAENWRMPESALGPGEVDWAVKPLRRSLLHNRLCRLAGRIERSVEGPDKIQAERRAFPGRKVLVVEDNAFNRSLLRRLLELRAARVFEACDGPEAIAAASRTRFDLILMDIHMPSMDGMETARRLRALAGAQGCPPIIGLSADVFAQGKTIAQDGAFDGFLLKPVSETALDRAILAALDPMERSGARSVHRENSAADYGSALSRLSGDLVELLLRETQTLYERLEAAIGIDDRDAVRQLAHGLKGLYGYFGRRELEASVRALECSRRQRDCLSAARKSERIAAAWQRLHPWDPLRLAPIGSLIPVSPCSQERWVPPSAGSLRPQWQARPHSQVAPVRTARLALVDCFRDSHDRIIGYRVRRSSR